MNNQNRILRFPDGENGSGAPPVQTSGAGTPPPAADTSAATPPPPAPSTPTVSPLMKLATAARDIVGQLLRHARAIGVSDINVLGPMENAYENAKNAVSGNTPSVEIAQAAHQAATVAMNAIANNSNTQPEQLQTVRDLVATLKAATDAAVPTEPAK